MTMYAQAVPELQRALRSEVISVSVAVKLVSSINSENAQGLIEFAKDHSCRELERHVMGMSPNLKTKERVSIVSDGLMKVTLTLTNEEYALFSRARDLESQRTGKASSLKDTSMMAVRDYLEKRDPVKKAERSKVRDERKEGRHSPQSSKSVVRTLRAGQKNEHRVSVGGSVNTPRELSKGVVSTSRELSKRVKNTSRALFKRMPLKAHEEHAVFLKTKGVCSYIDRHGEKFAEGKWVHIHHIVPVSEGGGNNPENLTLLCSQHHDLVHQMELPLGEIRFWEGKGRQVQEESSSMYSLPENCALTFG